MGIMAEREVGPMLASASLGEVLRADRALTDVGLDDLSRRSRLDVAQIEAVEAGRHDLTEAQLCALLDDYASFDRARRPHRALVEIDLDAGSLRLRRSRRPGSLPAADRNLLHYLSMVHRHHDLDLGTEIPLKVVDLSLLRASLALRRDDVTSRLDRMAGTFGPGLTGNRSLLTVALATGLVVAAGAIVLVPSARSEPDRGPVGPPVEHRLDIGTPLVIERDESELPTFIGPATDRVTGSPASAGGAAPTETERDLDQGGAEGEGPVGPTPRIGSALVVERPPEDVDRASVTTGTAGPRGPPAPNRMISP